MPTRISLPGLCLALVMLSTGVAKDTVKIDWRQQQRNDLDQRIRDKERRLSRFREEERALKHNVDFLEKNLPTAKEQLKTAEKNEAEAVANMAAAQESMKGTQGAVRTAQQRLEEIERKLEESQPASSPFAKASTAFAVAKAAYKQAVDRLLSSPEYKTAYEETTAPQVRAGLRKQWLDQDAGVTEATAKLKDTKATYENLRSELFHGSAEWKDAAAALDKAKKEDNAADRDGRADVGRQASAKKRRAIGATQVKAMEVQLSHDRGTLKGLPKKIENLKKEIDRDRDARRRL